AGVATIGITGTATVTKRGKGTLYFTGTHTYTGTTLVEGGRLMIHGNNAAATGDVVVLNGALLGGSGTVGGAITIHTGATLSPFGERPTSASQIDPSIAMPVTIRAKSTVTLHSGAALVLRVWGNNTDGYRHDVVAMANPANNQLIFKPGAIVFVDLRITNGQIDDPFFALSVIQGASISEDGLRHLVIRSNFNKNIAIVLNKDGVLMTGMSGMNIPEPSTYALYAAGLLSGLLFLRRRQKTTAAARKAAIARTASAIRAASARAAAARAQRQQA
ncbi:MAG: PEP-CTERM sorting domain-containing protein, partial [Puniceicoccales bacterium]|nr:PEP-CTERM sorting domain-containing protein [Puniceicoccales bacterium]